MRVAIIGGGAAGYFAAINMKEISPSTEVTIYEASSKSLAKVGVSGGGRCNLSNSFEGIKDLSRVYPRGAKLMKRLFKTFDHKQTQEWFEDRGVELVTQEDHCIFPKSQSSQEIVDTLLNLTRESGVVVKHSHRVASIESHGSGYRVSFEDPKLRDIEVDSVVVTTGGSPKRERLKMLDSLGLEIMEPVPSLFSFNIPSDPITELMGAVVDPATITLQGTKLKASGALLITHWGISGPAALKLSSYAARVLSESHYTAKIAVNWVNESNFDRVQTELLRLTRENSAKLVTNVRPFNLPSRLWLALLQKADISHERRFVELGSKGINRLVNLLINDEYEVKGQSRFRDEFVTCGGVALSNVNIATMECKSHPNLYFAGEVLDVDAITGGFNLQAAWSMGYVVARELGIKS